MLAASQMLVSGDASLQWGKIEIRDLKNMRCQILLQKILGLGSPHSTDESKVQWNTTRLQGGIRRRWEVNAIGSQGFETIWYILD